MQMELHIKNSTICSVDEVTGVKLVVVVVEAVVEDLAMDDVIIHSPRVRVNHLMVVNFVVNVNSPKTCPAWGKACQKCGKKLFQEQIL